MDLEQETIAARASAPGMAGIGSIRVSGPKVTQIANSLMGRLPEPRVATPRLLKDASGETIDQAVALFLKAPIPTPAKTRWSCIATVRLSFWIRYSVVSWIWARGLQNRANSPKERF